MKFLTRAAFAAHVALLTADPAAAAQNPITEREKSLLNRIEALEKRLAALEGKADEAKPLAPQPAAAPVSPSPPAIENANPWLKDTTLNFYFDGYYSWNANRPLGRINLLRAYDVTSNNFSINQTGFVVEKAVNPSEGRRIGYRLDLMFGQATETLQGGAQNEPRPQVYRNVFQAYGTYAAPIGGGLTLDFGKWSSALGPEGNYTKDQINYSRSYFFNFLPFYHMGLRASYPVNQKLSLAYWLVNGANQTEDFNRFKSQLAQAVIKPSPKLTWTLNYYVGREQRDLAPALNPGIPQIPSQPGLSTTPLIPVARGRFHVIDTYASWNASSRLTLAGELDYVVNRVESGGPPQRITGGAAYLRYQLTPAIYLGQRYVRLNDNAGLFSGVSQNLDDLTSTLGFRFGESFETRLEYRRDFSNVPFFFQRDPGSLSRHQDTFALGMLWWHGGKAGSW
jgi:hypothetical protein